MPRLSGWKLAKNKLVRTFEFQDFVQSLSFVNSLVAYFETVDHHPDVRIAYGEITFEKGRVKQRNFHDYRMLRMHEMPEVDVHVVESTESMGGVGEPGVPPVAPAVGNAIFRLTGKRLRSLPFRPEELKR